MQPAPNMTTITGPTEDSQSFSTKLSSPVEAETYGYCTGLDPGVKTWRPEAIVLDLTLSAEKVQGAGAADVSGYIGLKSDRALSLSSKMSMKKGCSRPEKEQACTADRYGFRLCSNTVYL